MLHISVGRIIFILGINPIVLLFIVFMLMNKSKASF